MNTNEDLNTDLDQPIDGTYYDGDEPEDSDSQGPDDQENFEEGDEEGEDELGEEGEDEVVREYRPEQGDGESKKARRIENLYKKKKNGKQKKSRAVKVLSDDTKDEA